MVYAAFLGIHFFFFGLFSRFTRLDARGRLYSRNAKDWWRRNIRSNTISEFQSEIYFLQRLIGKLRGGMGLHNCLVDQSLQADISPKLRDQIKRSLDYYKDEGSTVLELLFQTSLRNGNPCMQALQFYKKIQETRLRSEQKKISSSTQARVQAYFVCAIPWILIFSLFLMDPTFFAEQSRNSLCVFLWVFSLLLDIIGLLWMRNILRTSFEPSTLDLKEIEEDLPDFLFRFLPLLSSGIDVRDACAKALPKNASSESKLALAVSNLDSNSSLALPEEFAQFRELLRNTIRFGTPLREDVRGLLEELQFKKERRWEEALQKLPIRLMAPLFLCIFLAALAVLFSLVIPYAESL